MKYVDEFRDGALARGLGARIAAEVRPGRRYHFMEFCGGHTHAISRYGIAELLPPAIRLIHGPGCPVCVLPIGRIDQAIGLALDRQAIVCTYGDTMRVPASRGLSLTKAKAAGGDIRMLYSAADALKLARANPAREVVFFAIGFETTTPPTALVIRQAAREGLAHFSVLCCHVLTPSAITHILASPDAGEHGAVPIDGFVGPAHVSIVTGSRPYEQAAREHGRPIVIAGFEPLDVMQAVLMLVRQVNEGRAEVENQFARAVTRDGNLAAQRVVQEVFERRERFEWRGLGELPHSALKIRAEFAEFDAERRFGLAYAPVPDHPQCACGDILRGVRRPQDCRLFGSVCTPENPVGSCMVSSEGACAAHYAYGRFRDRAAGGRTGAGGLMAAKKDYLRPLDFRHGRIDMNHGAGGRAAMQLIDELFARAFDNEYLRQGNDGAALPAPPELLDGGRLVMACDGHVVSPLFFAGGDLGCLAVHGTVNDVAMLGARPLWLAASFILEEGFPLAELRRIVASMAAAAREAGVPVVTGDTKVVEQGKGDGCFIATTGVGVVARGVEVGGANARPGDVLLLSGSIGEHGVAVLSTRESLAFETTVRSDTAALHGLVAAMLAAAPGGVHALRDPTRGGLGTTLNEIARQSGVGMRIDEAAIPVQPQVEAACELLGLDLLYIANEGKLVAAVAPEAADAVLAAMRAHPRGAGAARIGSVVADAQRFVQMDTRFGGRRIVDWLSGEPLPRIC